MSGWDRNGPLVRSVWHAAGDEETAQRQRLGLDRGASWVSVKDPTVLDHVPKCQEPAETSSALLLKAARHLSPVQVRSLLLVSALWVVAERMPLGD